MCILKPVLRNMLLVTPTNKSAAEKDEPISTSNPHKKNSLHQNLSRLEETLLKYYEPCPCIMPAEPGGELWLGCLKRWLLGCVGGGLEGWIRNLRVDKKRVGEKREI